MKKRSIAYALAALLLTSCMLTSCAHKSSAAAASSLAESRLYQPSILRLEKSKLIATRDGLYIPQRDEIWHSDGRYRTLEQENLDLAAALTAERARQK
ncbi:MAG: hypothetical protein Q8M02_14660 [Candidatus Didemnitutus sp.]|nr:hypothetical protein [Candidatus Didemnitutus sp.]